MTDDLDPLYREMILDLYRHPLNRGVLDDADVILEDVNPSCGDQIKITIKFDAEGAIGKIAHDGYGCAISQAAVSLLTEQVKNKSKNEIARLTPDDVVTWLGIPINHTRMNCATLGLKILQKALQ